MTTKQVLSLGIGSRLIYANQNWEIIRWECFREPQFDSSGTRIDAIPILQNLEQNIKIRLDWLYWNEVNLA